jgi:hypothetical protein
MINNETADHTQTIESTWRAVKRSLPCSGTVKEMYNSYFAEFLYRRQYREEADQNYSLFKPD